VGYLLSKSMSWSLGGSSPAIGASATRWRNATEGLGCTAVGAEGICGAVPRPMDYEEGRGALDR